MQHEIDQKRIQKISQMLLEMASGNFTKRIERSGQDDELEALVVLINMVAEEMKESIFHFGVINPHFSYRHLVEAAFILDDYFIITGYTSTVSLKLGFSSDSLYGSPFMSLLSDQSMALWDSIKDGLAEDATYRATLPLTFTTQEKLLIPSFCMISRLLHSSIILISVVTTVVQETHISIIDKAESKELNYRPSDVHLIQNVYDYILENLHLPLPSLKELSRIFGTNDFKLKHGFKHLFNTSIYQFYNDERLKKAYLLIQQTGISIKSIAVMSGFKTYPNFSKSFKKRFGFSPYEMKRNETGFTSLPEG
jgi:AraC-like DNA-binding protein